ncbi:hypothetical protein PF004_g31132, partial [Phytophthora fragariae]
AYDLPGSFQRQRRPSNEGDVVELELRCNRVLVWDEVKVDDHFELLLTKSEIDKVAKDVKHGHKKFAPEFAVRLQFEFANPQDLTKLPPDAAA